jgi:putative MATE family efflux protein
MQVNHCAGAMLQSSGNMKVPSVLHILMCFLDVAFNLLFIFPSRTVRVLGQDIFLPGAGMGVTGAALGTALAELVIMMCMLYFLLVRSPSLHFRSGEKTGWNPGDIKKAAAISFPVAVESFVMNGAQIVSSRIVAPLGTIAIAANSFSVTAESLCYMPGYGIGQASTTLIGQSVGAGRGELARKMGLLTTGFAMAVMAVSGAIMYLIAPWMIGILSPDEGIRALGAGVLRIEAFAEPMYGASIVASGVFRGAGDTLIPSCLNFCSMWLVRIPLAALLSRSMGLKGVWIAMCLELWVRGALFLCRLFTKKRW